MPEILRSGETSFSQAGTIVLASYLGFVAATLASGVLADIFGNRGILWLAAVCLCVGGLGIGLANSYAALILFMAFIGLGLGAIELGANGLMVELHSQSRARYLNLLATFHGCGSLLVPLYAATLLQRGTTWQQVYFSSLLLALPLLVLFRPRSRLGSVTCTNEKGASPARSARAPWQWRATYRAAFYGRMRHYYLLIAAYVAVELSVAAWLMEFLQQERGMSVGGSSIYLSSFFVLLMLGRLLGALVVERTEYTLAIFIALVGTAACLAAGLFGTRSLAFMLPLSGFFMSIVFPTVTAAVTKLHVDKLGTILGILFAWGGLGGAVGPWVVGLVSQAAGLKLGLATSLLFVALASIALLSLRNSAVEATSR